MQCASSTHFLGSSFTPKFRKAYKCHGFFGWQIQARKPEFSRGERCNIACYSVIGYPTRFGFTSIGGIRRCAQNENSFHSSIYPVKGGGYAASFFLPANIDGTFSTYASMETSPSFASRLVKVSTWVDYMKALEQD